VNIDLSPNVFQYFSWGKNLFGIHHGDKCKMAALPMVMAADQAVLWGQAKYRKWFIGHFHNDTQVSFTGKEMQGCTAEIFRTIAATEGYAHEAGYRSDQDGKVLVFHKRIWRSRTLHRQYQSSEVIMTYKIMDDGLCSENNIPSRDDAIFAAEEIINNMSFADVSLFQIVNEETDEVELTFQGGDIDWVKS